MIQKILEQEMRGIPQKFYQAGVKVSFGSIKVEGEEINSNHHIATPLPYIYSSNAGNNMPSIFHLFNTNRCALFLKFVHLFNLLIFIQPLFAQNISESKSTFTNSYGIVSETKMIKDKISEMYTIESYESIDDCFQKVERKIKNDIEIPDSHATSKGCIIGNSTIAPYLGQNGIDFYLLSIRDIQNGNSCVNLAVPGHTINQQLLLWESDKNKKLYDWIIIEIGLNDLDPKETANIALERYQNMVNTIASQKKSSAKIILSAMTPARQRLINLYGSKDGMISYQKWLDMNSAIMGNGDKRITGCDYRIGTHSELLNDGNGNLSLIYDMGDQVHENNSGRKIIAAVWKTMLYTIGYLSDYG
jgi:lysophospholipase L1-like esterase